MPNHWQLTTLGEAADVEMGQSPPGDTYNSNGDGLPFLQGSAEFGERFPSPDRWCSAPTRVAEPGDLLVSVRAPVGDTNFADSRLAIGRGLARVRTTSVASSDFLRLVIQSEVGRLNQNAGGGMFASITARNLRGFRVALPPIPEQRRIVDLIGSIDSYIDSLQSQAKATRAVRSALLAELLSNSGDDWESTTLGESVQLNPESIRGYDSSFEFRYIDIGSVSEDSGINEGELEQHVVQSAPSRAQRIVRFGDVLVSTVRPNLRAFATVPASLDGEVASTGFVVLRAGQQVEPGFVWALVRTDAFVRHLVDRATGSSYPAVRASDVGSFPFEIPPIAEQRRIVDLIGSIDKQVASLETQAKSAQLFRGGVVSELLSGERLLDESYDVAFSS